ncbi:sensor histidine kinase [Lysobacter silvisoli]|uniref:Sensor histidine kinase n=1 Tax=Lysobacter silvisoli TaxID=2293254 RepID=A0A371K1J1_9GAMM|nr:histidine kinase [Lysobacter silvisoli]RDZ27793.1 sensor histidine kinase [Lysobacter silvisoli]
MNAPEHPPEDSYAALYPEPPQSLPKAASPYWLPVMACVPIGLCTLMMVLPVIDQGRAVIYFAMSMIVNMAWLWPLTLFQRWLRQRGTGTWTTVIALLLATYLMSSANNAFAYAMGQYLGWSYRLTLIRMIFIGVDSSWMVLSMYCAVHAVVAYYSDLQQAQLRQQRALALARDAELRALRYQLHPHFLFNTLGAISSLVDDQRNGDARQMIGRLAEFLRATLADSDRPEVSLAEELALTETYLEIERARLGDRLQLKWRIGPDVLRARVPALLLQPLVENAVRHGIAQRSQPGSLDIHIEHDGDRLHLSVYNDGPAKPTLSETAERRAGAVGLRNVAERLRALYPQAHSFDAGARGNGGYEVRLSLPYREVAVPRTAVAAAA